MHVYPMTQKQILLTFSMLILYFDTGHCVTYGIAPIQTETWKPVNCPIFQFIYIAHIIAINIFSLLSSTVTRNITWRIHFLYKINLFNTWEYNSQWIASI